MKRAKTPEEISSAGVEDPGLRKRKQLASTVCHKDWHEGMVIKWKGVSLYASMMKHTRKALACLSGNGHAHMDDQAAVGIMCKASGAIENLHKAVEESDELKTLLRSYEPNAIAEMLYCLTTAFRDSRFKHHVVPSRELYVSIGDTIARPLLRDRIVWEAGYTVLAQSDTERYYVNPSRKGPIVVWMPHGTQSEQERYIEEGLISGGYTVCYDSDQGPADCANDDRVLVHDVRALLALKPRAVFPYKPPFHQCHWDMQRFEDAANWMECEPANMWEEELDVFAMVEELIYFPCEHSGRVAAQVDYLLAPELKGKFFSTEWKAAAEKQQLAPVPGVVTYRPEAVPLL